jgi:hypothetical protein
VNHTHSSAEERTSRYEAKELRRRVIREAGLRYDMPNGVLADWLEERGRAEDADRLRRLRPGDEGWSPWSGVCKLGPERFFWVLWADIGHAADDLDPDASGYATTREQAEADRASSADRLGVRLKHKGAAGIASQWHRVLVALKRGPVSLPPTAEYVYHHYWSTSEYPDVPDSWSTYRHRIIRRTARRIFALRDGEYIRDGGSTSLPAGATEHGRVEVMDTIALDRATLERGEEVWHGRGWGSKRFTLNPNPPAGR